uniref:hypothetical protein n=1 Tax=Parerythrobacter lutipelagi TaxID=1964208 RepID=UPI0010F60F7D|nr:hypothetical protein [Parerythrobacter lutipelagi]
MRFGSFAIVVGATVISLFPVVWIADLQSKYWIAGCWGLLVGGGLAYFIDKRLEVPSGHNNRVQALVYAMVLPVVLIGQHLIETNAPAELLSLLCIVFSFGMSLDMIASPALESEIQ